MTTADELRARTVTLFIVDAPTSDEYDRYVAFERRNLDHLCDEDDEPVEHIARTKADDAALLAALDEAVRERDEALAALKTTQDVLQEMRDESEKLAVATVRADAAEKERDAAREAAFLARRILKDALTETMCDGDLCAKSWHEDARRVLGDDQ